MQLKVLQKEQGYLKVGQMEPLTEVQLAPQLQSRRRLQLAANHVLLLPSATKLLWHRQDGVGPGGGQAVSNQNLTRFHGIWLKFGYSPANIRSKSLENMCQKALNGRGLTVHIISSSFLQFAAVACSYKEECGAQETNGISNHLYR